MVQDETESDLLARAASFAGFPRLADLTTENLRRIGASEGIDFATALFYDRVTRSDGNSSFIAQINQLKAAGFRTDANRLPGQTIVAIVPAAFYKEKPHSGADGRVVRDAATEAGLKCELIPIGSTDTLKENSAILLDWLKNHSANRIVLVSLCKGGADVKFALNASAAETRFANVGAWINICGTLSGSLVAQWLLATKIRSLATWLLLKSGGHDLAFLKEVVPSPTGPLSGPVQPLPAMQMINIVGFPLRRHLSNAFMRRCHKILSVYGPNDGGVLLAEACHLPGFTYPVWGADHYLRPDDHARQIILAIFQWLARRPAPQDPAHSPKGLCPAT
jgi:hypothetical protein